jgi:hypothetical protein
MFWSSKAGEDVGKSRLSGPGCACDGDHATGVCGEAQAFDEHGLSGSDRQGDGP